MTIDISQDELIAIRDTPSFIHKRTGKRPHIASIYRWISVGIQGVRLETIAVGGSQFTSATALNLFFRLTAKAKHTRHAAKIKQGLRKSKLDREQQLEGEAKEFGI